MASRIRDDITGVGQISWAPDSRRFVYDQFFERLVTPFCRERRQAPSR